jgi:hypothetical protein
MQMTPIITNGTNLLANTWTAVVIPNACRDSIRFQANSLGVLKYSFDAGASYMQTVGAGEYLNGNFSGKTIWFMTSTNDVVNIMILDKLY